MIRSMTGFGRGEATAESLAVRVEVRSVNNRHLKIVQRLADLFQTKEAVVEKVVRESLSRGTVYVTIEVDALGDDPGYSVDPSAVRHYRRALEALKGEFGDERPLDVLQLLSLPGCLSRTMDDPEAQEATWAAAETALRGALKELSAMRIDEGARLWDDMVTHTRAMAALVDDIDARKPEVLAGYTQRLKSRVAKLTEGMGINVSEQDLARELAIFAERSDVSEEISRLRSHIEHFEDIPNEDADEPCGRKIEFLVQEMLREANTTAAKVNDADLVHLAVRMKLEIDKIREQTLNVE